MGAMLNIFGHIRSCISQPSIDTEMLVMIHLFIHFAPTSSLSMVLLFSALTSEKIRNTKRNKSCLFVVVSVKKV